MKYTWVLPNLAVGADPRVDDCVAPLERMLKQGTGYMSIAQPARTARQLWS